jgi:hypothetical protein
LIAANVRESSRRSKRDGVVAFVKRRAMFPTKH